MNAMMIAAESAPESAARLKRELKSVETRRYTTMLALTAPFAIFLLPIFVVSVGALLARVAQNSGVADVLPKITIALKNWGRRSSPADAAYTAFAANLAMVSEGETTGVLAHRLNTEVPSFRSLVAKTAHTIPLVDD